MRYAIASDGTQVAPHFGRCEQYELVDIEDGAVKHTETMGNPGHAPGLLPRLLAEREVGVLIAGGAGPRAIGMLGQFGIVTCLGVSGPVGEAVAALTADTLEPGESACEH